MQGLSELYHQPFIHQVHASRHYTLSGVIEGDFICGTDIQPAWPETVGFLLRSGKAENASVTATLVGHYVFHDTPVSGLSIREIRCVMVNLHRGLNRPDEGLVDLNVVADTISVLRGKFLQARNDPPQRKVPEHLTPESKIGIPITIVLVVHKPDITEAVFRRVWNRQTIQNLQGTHASSFIGNLRPVKVLQHAQIVTTAASCTVLQH